MIAIPRFNSGDIMMRCGGIYRFDCRIDGNRPDTAVSGNSESTVSGIRTGGFADRCFQSLRESTYPVTTIVIDNASGDGSADYIREHFPEVIVMESDKNLGFGNANNMGMKYAREHDCDYVFLFNQDTWVDANMMEKLVIY